MDEERKSLHFSFHQPACQVYLQTLTPQWRPKSPHWCHQQYASCFEILATKQITKGGREEIQRATQRKPRKGMEDHKAHIQCTLLSTGCAKASFSLPLGLNRKKAALWGKSLKMFIVLWLQIYFLYRGVNQCCSKMLVKL